MYFEFEKLDAYQLAVELVVAVETVSAKLERGSSHRKRQLERSAASVADNIAEGCGEFAADERRRFMRIARRSGLEAASQLIVIRRMGKAPDDLVNEALRILHPLIGKVTVLARTMRDRR